MSRHTPPPGWTQTVTKGRGLDPYGRLIQMLLPRVRNVGVYAADGACLWSASGRDDPSLASIAKVAAAAAEGAPFFIDGFSRPYHTAIQYAFRLRGVGGSLAAVVALSAPEIGEEQPYPMVLELLRPALECLSRELELRVSVAGLRSALARNDGDLNLLATRVAADEAGTPVAAVLGEAIDGLPGHLSCLAVALVIPDCGVALVRGADEQIDPRVRAAITQTHRQLLGWARSKGTTLMANAAGAAPKAPYHALSAPISPPNGPAVGFLAVYRTAASAPFESQDARLVELIGRKLSGIISERFDGQTGLATRASFDAEVIALLQSPRATPVSSVLYLDVDQMHVINENFGLPVGDQVVSQVAALLRARRAEGAIATRLSGDRFAMFLPGRSVDEAATLGDTVRQAANRLGQSIGDATLHVGVSIGVASLPRGAREALALSQTLAAAEIACRAAKDRGRNRVERFESGDESVIRRFDDLHQITRLRDAIERNDYVLYAQRIEALGDIARPPRYEILLRLRGGNGELVAPDKFLSAAERYQMMPELDQWVISRSFAMLSDQRAALADHPVGFAINLSAQSLGQEGLVTAIERLRSLAGVPAASICFELTETAAVGNLSRTARTMQDLRELGFQFALDDFGTGQSSLVHLKSLPVSILKIDGAFVRDAVTSARSADMVRAIAQLARTLGMLTVAEYVESEALRVLMTSLGVDYGQGFAIGKPLPLADVLRDLGQLTGAAAPGAAPRRGAGESDLARRVAAVRARSAATRGMPRAAPARDGT